MTESTVETSPSTRYPDLGGPLTRYRVIAYVVGVFLLVLVCVAMPMKYAGSDPRLVALVGPLHGFLYMVYLVLSAHLALRARWSVKGTVLVLLAGTVPFVSFVAERVVVKRTRDGRRL